MIELRLDSDRLFPAEPSVRSIARRLYEHVRSLPIVSPHGHTDPAWFSRNEPFADPATLLVVPDHYVFRMLYSKGIALEALGGDDRGEARRFDRAGRDRRGQRTEVCVPSVGASASWC
jgi:glucuronate isomerase